MDALGVQAVQLTRSRADWAQLAAAAVGGQLWMEPGVAEKAAARCVAMVATLELRRQDAQGLVFTGNMGDCLVGNQLRAAFTSKAIGESNSLISVITQHQQILTDMAATYRAAGAAFAARESANAAALGSSA